MAFKIEWFNIKMCKTINVNEYLIDNVKYNDEIVLGC